MLKDFIDVNLWKFIECIDIVKLYDIVSIYCWYIIKY